ncbi:hypothetical protein ACYOEI_34980, partial [Singulisphaera rosea]
MADALVEEAVGRGVPCARVGEVVGPPGRDVAPRLTVLGLDGSPVIEASIADLKDAWQSPLRW